MNVVDRVENGMFYVSTFASCFMWLIFYTRYTSYMYEEPCQRGKGKKSWKRMIKWCKYTQTEKAEMEKLFKASSIYVLRKLGGNSFKAVVCVQIKSKPTFPPPQYFFSSFCSF